MKNLTSRIVAGTALALLMTSAAGAAPSVNSVPSVDPIVTGPVPDHTLLLAQAEPPGAEEQAEENRRRQQAEEQPENAPVPKRKAKPEPEARKAEPAQPGQPAQEAQPPRQAQPAEPAQPAQEPEPKAPRQARPEAPAEDAAPNSQQQAEPTRRERREQRRQQAEEQQAEPQKQDAEQAEEPTRRERREQRRQQAEEQKAEPQKQDAEQAEEPTLRERRNRRNQEQQAQPEQPAQQGEQPAQQAQPEQPAQEGGQQPADQAEQPAQPGEQPAQQAQPGQEAQPQDAAPVLDSAKERRRDRRNGQQQGEQAAQPEQPQQPRADAPPPPENDAAAQSEEIRNEEIKPVTAEEGQRIEVGNSREERRKARRERRERRENAEVVREFDDNRTIIEINNQVFIESPDNDRLILDRDEVYYEELPRGRTREVITRPDGTRVITIRNRYGDVVRRSRILPDDREVVLVYVEDRYYEDVRDFRDPGADLPPLVLNIPREEYILEADTVESPDAYYTFFEQPPVEQIQRTYSIDEVKRSARLRDTVRRVDLDSINFEFGSDQIAESEVDTLQGVADAMLRILEENPGETFLIEGHTDAVGSDLANLALSDRRAEAVAEALTSVFDIPPENLATQGYGEQYLKVDSQEPERENRRVAMRRITPLVAPVASAN